MTESKLTTEHKRILKHKQVAMNRTPAELMEFLMPLALYDRAAERMRKLSCGVSVVAFLLVVAGCFVVVNVMSQKILGWAIVGALLLVFIGSFANYRRLAGVDLSNNLRSFVFPVLAILREETAPGERVQIKLDLRAATIKEKKTSESPRYSEGAYHKIIDRFFTDPWFEGSTVLADQSKLRWSVVDHIRERKKTKRNHRGKYKTKTKHTRKTAMEVEVKLPEKRYGLVTEGVDAKHAGKRNVVRLHRVLKTNTLDTLEPAAFIDLIAEAYRHTMPAKVAGV